MNTHPNTRFWSIATLAIVGGLMLPPSLSADTLETVGGSTLRGHIVASDGGIIRIETDFAGVIDVKQDQIKSITTDDPLFVALQNGNTLNGRITTSNTSINVAGNAGSIQTATGDITALWRAGDKSPAEKALAAAQRKWAYELAFDLNGRSGNSDRTFLGVSGKAVLEGKTDRLMFNANYSRSEENGATTQDEGKAGVDYSNFFSDRMSWYVRTELGYDHTKALDLRSQSAAGVGYTVINKPTQKLEFRGGLSYRFESYRASPDFDSAGLDLGILHTLTMDWGRLSQSLSITPSFEDFGNFVLVHDSSLELPLKGDKPWKVRLGVKTDYSSDPQPGFEKLDWTYYTQLVLSWR